MGKLTIERKKLILEFDEDTLNFSVRTGDKTFFSDTRKNAYIELADGEKSVSVPFGDCTYSCRRYQDGLGEGIAVNVSGGFGSASAEFELECRIWIDIFDALRVEISPIKDCASLRSVRFPAHFDFHYTKDAYSVLPIMQGNLLFNDVEITVKGFEPSVFYERMGYMAFYGQLAEGTGFIAVVQTPYDAGYRLFHAGKGETELGVVWNSSMRGLSYTRKIDFEFVENADYNDLCKIYRRYAKENGTFRTLKEKAAAKSCVGKLLGGPVIHAGALYDVKKGTLYYDEKDPSQNYRLKTFGEIEAGIKRLSAMGLKKAYLHLDGWGKAGYDREHPDVLPPCEAAGGAEGMKSLADTCKKLNILFAIHDQYRDYYTDAKTFDEKNAIMNADGVRGGECCWFGGDQKYLCTVLAEDYVKRNLEGLKSAGIELDGVYLDVFSVIKLEECYDPRHKMTRKENMEYRSACFRLLNAKNLVASSEEPVEWAVPWMDLVHHGPYCVPIDEFSYEMTPVPLFNLVYHECIVLPWDISADPWGLPKNKDGYLYALLNGGVPYLPLDADESVFKKVQFACELQSKICYEEMEKHEILGDGKERAYYASCIVEVDFNDKSYKVTKRI